MADVSAEAQGAVLRRVCANCRTREATVRWGDALTTTHGGGGWWCEFCAVTAQLAHARERAAMISDLEARLAALGEPVSGGEGA